MVATTDDAKKAAAAPPKKGAKDQPPTNPDDDLSDEDLALKRELEQLVDTVRADASKPAAAAAAALQLGEKIRTATASMTSVPKPLKFLRPHAQDLKARWAALPASAADARRALADVVSVLASTGAPRDAPGGARRAARLRECLRFKVAGTRDDVGSWGHEYMRHLAGEIAAEYAALHERDETAASGGAALTAADEEAEAAAADEADLARFEAGLGDEDDDGKAAGDKAAGGADKDAKKDEGGGKSSGGAAAPPAAAAEAKDAADKAGGEGGDKKKKGGGKGDDGKEREPWTPEQRAAWLAQQRAIRAALPRVTMADIMALVEQIAPYHMRHNAEPEAVDLLLEVERLDLLPPLVDAKSCARTCLYLASCAPYLGEPDDRAVLETAHAIYSRLDRHHDALRIALRLGDRDRAEATFAACPDPTEKKQLAYLLARHGLPLDLEGDGPAAQAVADDDALKEDLRAIMSNSLLSEHYLALARDLDVLEPKVPEDVYKSHLATDGQQPAGAAAVDSARANLAATLVNAFLNAGFGQDKLVTPAAGGGGAAGEGGAAAGEAAAAAGASAAPVAGPNNPSASSDAVHWVFKNKDHGKAAAVASLGMVALWDVEGGLPAIDKYLYSTDPHVVAGALLAIGTLCCCVQNENDPAFALIADYVSNADPVIRSGAILGLGLAYAGTRRAEVSELLVPVAMDSDCPAELSGLAALALGLVFCASADPDVVEALLTALMARPEHELATPGAKQMALGLGLLFLGKQEAAEATAEVARAALHPKIARYASVTLDALAYAGTGNVLKVQELLAVCGEHPEAEFRAEQERREAAAKAEAEAAAAARAKATAAAATAVPAAPAAVPTAAGAGAGAGAAAEGAEGAAAAPAAAPEAKKEEGGEEAKKEGGGGEGEKKKGEDDADDDDDAADAPWRSHHQSPAVVGLALVASAEPLGAQMAARALDHLLQYGDPAVRRAVPLALALLHASDPDALAMDALSRLSHDADGEVAASAALALGLLGAGTNHARLAGLLRNLAAYHHREPTLLYLVRVSQGLVHAGKGLLSLCPYHSDRQLLSGVALAGLLAVTTAAEDVRSTLAGKQPWLFYCLAAALKPRMLMTLDAQGKPLPAAVRVGQAVDVVAQAGRPKTVTGFQTHDTPVLLAQGERAELATDKWLPLAPLLEGCVILKPNPEWVERAE